MIVKDANENNVMYVEGQYGDRARPDAGYAMAVLLAGIAIMGIVWTMVVPVWKQSVQREKEAELIFRAGQYARAVALYQRKYANAFPPTVDVLLKEKFLRRKYKDPITNADFRYLSPLELQALPGLTTTTPGIAGRAGPAGAQPTPSPSKPTPRGGSFGSPSSLGQGQGLGTPQGLSPGGPGGTIGGGNALGPNGPTAGPQAGIAAVVSKSTAASIKVFKNRRQYNQWVVTVQDVMPRSAVGMQPGMQPGQQPGINQPGGRSMSPGPSQRPTFPSRP
jgi:type II secretory pathway pseudopilin PulG